MKNKMYKRTFLVVEEFASRFLTKLDTKEHRAPNI